VLTVLTKQHMKMTSISKSLALLLSLMIATACASNPFEAKQTTATAQSAYVSKLMRGAVATENSQLRHLDEEYEIDISGYSLKFEKCQFIKQFDDELAEDEDSETVLGTKRFIIFRLCPSDNCASSCNYGYGEYIIDMEEYLEATIGYAQEKQEEMCQLCDENCEEYYGNDANGDEGENENEDRRLDFRELASDCSTCMDICDLYENMADNGYVDATAFINCVEIKDEGDDGVALFASAMCASGGSKVKIGVFSDEECMFIEPDLNVEDYLVDDNGNQINLSHLILQKTYRSDNCISCDAGYYQDDDNVDDKATEVLDMCAELYEASAKCEKIYGFDNGYANYDGYENQVDNEAVVCEFISSLKSGTYSQEGEIVVGGSNYGGTTTTGGQKLTLAFFIVGTAVLSAYACMLYKNLAGKTVSLNLSSQVGGTLT